MSVVKFCALGGLGEVGKNMFVFDVDDKIFIFDAGLKYPSVELYGIDTVMPDITYLLNNKDKIQGVFLSHGHSDHTGAIVELARNFNVGIYGTNFTLSIVELELAESGVNVEETNLIRITENDIIKFDNLSVRFFNTTHSIPETLGIAIQTPDGAIVYAPDFTFASVNEKSYKTSFGKIASLAENGVLMLCTDSMGAINTDRVTNDYAFCHAINEVLLNSKRIIFSMFSTDLDRIQKIINLSIANNRKIAILGRKAQKLINVAMNTEYLTIPKDSLLNLKYIDETNDNNYDDLAIIIAGSRHEPYYMLHRMSTGQDRLVSITDDDNIVIVSSPVIGTEKIAAKTIDTLQRYGAKIQTIPKSILRSSHADSEDLKMMYSMLKPKYLIPVSGEYRHQYMQRNIAREYGFEDDKIIMLDNGVIISFVDGELQDYTEKVSCGDVLVDGSIVGDINEVVIKDREMLSQEGAVVVAVTIDSNEMEIIAGPKIVMRGFVTGQAADNITSKITLKADQIIHEFIDDKKRIIDWNEVRNTLRDSLEKEIMNLLNKNPIVMPIIIDVNGEEIYEKAKKL